MKRLFNLIGTIFVAIARALGEKMHVAIFGFMANNGLILSLDGIPTDADFKRYRVTNQDSSEVIRQRLYDYQLYPLAGVAQLSFFTLPQGQGVTSTNGAVVGSAKTVSDTNMQMGAQLPSGMEYLIESIEVYFKPGSSAAANTFVPAKVTTDATGAFLAAAISGLNDVDLVYNTGLLQFNVLNKPQLTETPLRAFPPKTWMELDAATATAVGAATLQSIICQNYPSGRPYYLEPCISLQPAVNFGVTINYPAAQALPSGFNGRVGVVFDGYLRRASQ